MYPSHSSRFKGVLLQLLEALERAPNGPGLKGQDVVLERDGVSAVLALDPESNIHLLVNPIDANSARLSELSLNGLRAGVAKWVVGGRLEAEYLDISCATGATPAFKRPFVHFAEDLLYELDRPGVLSSDAFLITGNRWKRFWNSSDAAILSRERIQGLFGELLFLEEVVRRFGTTAVHSWFGPEGHDHDFQRGKELGVEVKTAMDTPHRIYCNLRQLDQTLFKELYVACYILREASGGESLGNLVSRVEALFEGDEHLDTYYSKLASAGYNFSHAESYARYSYLHDAPLLYKIDDSFPKITHRNFAGPIDHRIKDVRYLLELSGLDSVDIDSVGGAFAPLGHASG